MRPPASPTPPHASTAEPGASPNGAPAAPSAAPPAAQGAAPGAAPGVADASLAAILSIAADAIITVDERYRVVQFNRGAEEIFGYPADEMLGQPLERLIPERFRPAHRGHVTDFAAAAHPARRMGERQEIWALARGGREFPAEASISKIDGPGGRLYTVVLRDVSARHRSEVAERLLADAGARLAASLDPGDTARTAAAAGVPVLADAAVAVLAPTPPPREAPNGSPNGRPNRRPDGPPAAPPGDAATRAVSAASPHADADVASLLDALAAEGAAGRLWADVGDEARAATDDVPAWIGRHAATPAVRALALALRPRGVLVAPLRPTGAPPAASEGELTWFAFGERPPFDDADLALARALAERAALAAVAARLYADARRAVRARDEVLAVVSHDLRNPLSTVAMCAAALDRSGDAETRQLAGTVRQAVGWMQAIIDDLLEVARIEGGRLALERAPVDAAALVRQAAALHATAASAAGLTLAADADVALPPLAADGARLLRALGNLVDNAVKFTPAGGRVDVRAEAGAAGGTRFVVRDTGRGIAAEHLPHLFERFWQARAQRRGGAGLGLAIARGIAEAHGGTLEVASVLGEGTTFTLLVPPGAEAAPG